VPEQVIPMRMRREACHNGLARIGQVVREGGHFVAVHPGVDEQHASPAVHDNGVALAELALVDQHTLRDLPQHGCKATVPSARQQRFAQRASPRCRSVCLAARQLITVTPFDAAPAEDRPAGRPRTAIRRNSLRRSRRRRFP
jgi:hypothetical protein